MTKTLVIVPCGGSKIWKKRPDAGPTRARKAYIGPPFIVNLEYAEKFADKWVILSAKYGFIDGDFVIPENYNVTFNDIKTNPISVEKLKDQVRERLSQYKCVISLGSTAYANMVITSFKSTNSKVITPTAGLKIGYAMGKVKNATRTKTPFTCNP